MRKILSLALALAVCLGLAGCGHTHVWKDADCTAPKTCTECGETEGEMGPHVWVEATCEEPKHCEVCGLTEGEPLGHEWVEATTESPKTCSRCGLTEGEPLSDTYFMRNGLEFEELQDFELPFAVAFVDDAGENEVEIDGVWAETEMAKYTFWEPECSERDGYIQVIITYTQTGSYTVYGDTSKFSGALHPAYGLSSLGVGDSYTGLIVPKRATMGDDTVETEKSFEWDGNTYSISVEEQVIANASPSSQWAEYSGTVYQRPYDFENMVMLDVTIPEDYDGAVLYIERDGMTDASFDESNWEIKDKDEHFLDEHDADYYMFFRLSDFMK